MVLDYLFQVEYHQITSSEEKRLLLTTFQHLLITNVVDDCCTFEIRENLIFISWNLFTFSLISSEQLVTIVSSFLEVYPPSSSRVLSSSSYSPYSPVHHVVWKMLAVVLGPISREKRLVLDSPVSSKCEIFRYFSHNVISGQNDAGSQNSVGTDIDDRLPFLSFYSKADQWLQSLLSGSILNECCSVVLPSRFEELLASLDSNDDAAPSRTSSFSCSEMEKVKFHFLDELLEEKYSDFLMDVSSFENVVTQVGSFFSKDSAEDSHDYFHNSQSKDTFRFSGDVSNHEEAYLHYEKRSFISILHPSNRLRSFLPQTDPTVFLSVNVDYVRNILVMFACDRNSFNFLRHFCATSDAAKHFSVDKTRTSFCNQLGSNPLQKIKEARRNRSTGSAFIFGSRLLEVLCYQSVVCSHLISQDCFLPTRTVQLLFQHYQCFSEIVSAVLENPEDAERRSEFLLDIERKKDHVLSCLQYLKRNGLNLRRSLKMAFDMAARSAGFPASSAAEIILVPESRCDYKTANGYYR
jgi:hypothetical protein